MDHHAGLHVQIVQQRRGRRTHLCMTTVPSAETHRPPAESVAERGVFHPVQPDQLVEDAVHRRTRQLRAPGHFFESQPRRRAAE